MLKYLVQRSDPTIKASIDTFFITEERSLFLHTIKSICQNLLNAEIEKTVGLRTVQELRNSNVQLTSLQRFRNSGDLERMLEELKREVVQLQQRSATSEAGENEDISPNSVASKGKRNNVGELRAKNLIEMIMHFDFLLEEDRYKLFTFYENQDEAFLGILHRYLSSFDFETLKGDIYKLLQKDDPNRDEQQFLEVFQYLH